MKRLIGIPVAVSFIGYALVYWMMRELDALIAPDMFDVEEDWDEYDR